MKTYKKILYWSLVLAGVFIFWSAATQAQMLFKVLVVKGKTEVQRTEKGVWDKISVGISLSNADKIRIAKDGYISLAYVPNGKTFELKNIGTHKISDLAKEAAALSGGAAANLSAYMLSEMSSSNSDDHRQNMGVTASVDRALEQGSKKNVVIPTGDGKTVQLYKNSYALLIGVSDYTEGWPKLPGVKNDIEAVKSALEEHGFTTVTVSNPDHDQLDEAFRTFINKYCMDVENRVIFYFAGHGHTLRQSYGEEMGYIIPTDAPNPNRNSQGFIGKAMAMQQIEVYAKQIQSKHALFLFDACFSGSIFSLSRAIPENITYKTTKPVRQFISSGAADETVPDKSVFRQQFISALKGEADGNKDGYVTGTELGEYLQDRVVNYSKNSQHPQYGKIRNPNLDKGDFVFSIRVAVSLKQDESGTVRPVITDVSVEPASRQPEPAAWRSSSPIAQLGVRGSLNYSMMSTDLTNASIYDKEPASATLSGVGFTFGLTATVPFNESLGMLFNLGYDSREARVNLYSNLNEGDYFLMSLRYISADILLRYSISNFWIAAGPALFLQQSAQFTEKLIYGASSLGSDGAMRASTTFELGARFGIGYDISLSPTITLAPDVLVGLHFANPSYAYEVDGDTYILLGKMLTLQAGISLRFGL